MLVKLFSIIYLFHLFQASFFLVGGSHTNEAFTAQVKPAFTFNHKDKRQSKDKGICMCASSCVCTAHSHQAGLLVCVLKPVLSLTSQH